MMNERFIKGFMEHAFSASRMSTCPRAHVGAVVAAKNGKVVGTGYNGAPKGVPHCEDVGCILDGNGSCAMAVHAEINAILGLSHFELEDATLFCTHRPCFGCTKVILNTGIVAVYYAKEYNAGPFADKLIELSKGRVYFAKVEVLL